MNILHNNTFRIVGFLTFLFVICFYTQALAQHPYYQAFNNENGLPSNEVYQIVQDQKGYIWIGCDAGLYRYDGIRFKAFYSNKQNSKSISNLYINASNQLWCSNFSGQLFRINNDSLHLIADYSTHSGKFQICYSENYGYWKFDQQLISHHNENGKVIKEYPIMLPYEINGNGTDLKFHNNILWIEIAGRGLHYLDTLTGEFTLHFPTKENIVYQNQRLFIQKNELYLVRSEEKPSVHNYIYKIADDTKMVTQIYYFYNPKQIRNYSFYEDKLHRLWVASSYGAVCIPNVYEFTVPEKVAFVGNKISSVFHDNEGNFWFSDLQNGMYRIPNLDILEYKEKPTNPNSISSDVTALYTLPNGLVVIGHYNGKIGFFDPQQNEYDYPDVINKLQGITVKDIEYANGKLYISRGHLLVYDLANKTVFYPELFANARDLCIVKDSVFSVHPEYVAAFALNDIKKGADLHFKIVHKVGGRKLVYDEANDQLYLGLNDGLYLYEEGKLSKIKIDEKECYVQALHFDGTNVWASSQTHGLIKFNNGVFVANYFSTKGNENYPAKSIYSDGDFVWTCFHNRLIKMEIATGKSTFYSNHIGINPKDVACLTVSNNTLFVGSKKKLTTLPISLEPENAFQPNLFFESITLNNQAVEENENLFEYDFTNLRFEFISFSYKSQNDLVYHYRLVGFDTTWYTTPNDQPSVLYASLPSGNFRFEVYSTNESGIPSELLSFSFTIKTPLWQKGWFYFIVSIISISVIALIFMARIKVIRRRNEIEKKLISSQLATLKAQMNPHFMYNALNSIQALIFQNDIKNSTLYLGKFSHLMRRVLESSGKDTISLQEEIEILKLYLDLEKLRFGSDLAFEIKIENDLNIYDIYIPPMLIQPYIENAFKHGLLHKKGDKKLMIRFFQKDNAALCEITDNGIGRKHAEEIKARLKEKHQSFATQATEKRVELLNTITHQNYTVTIEDLYENNQPVGTRVQITISLLI